MAISVITPAVAERLTVSEVKSFLRVDSDDEDTLLAVLISAAREMAEKYTRQILMTTTIEEFYDIFPEYTIKDSDIIYLSRGPIQSITSVKYVDTLGDEITITNDKYNTDLISEPGRIISTAGWYATKDTVNAVVVRYVVGYSSASDVPAAIKQAMLLLIGEMYEKRIDSVKRLPTAAEYLMNPYRVFTYY